MSAGNHTTPGVNVAQIPTATAAIGCGGCSSRWNGLTTAHCSACHQTFTTVTAFNKHRTGSYSQDTRHCLEPASVGLVDASRAYPCWGLPAPVDGRTGSGDPAQPDEAVTSS